ncbi:MAG: hypothetical protein JWM34_1002 [Ilumatobacteraceae bacterium]|nr:hypothetical protein [Ilumatobacteraceae bacterium]
MIRVNTTVVVVISPADATPLEAVRASNVRVVRPNADDPPIDRSGEVWEQARHTSSAYLLHDADPLAAVASAWIARLDGTGVVGDLEVAVSATLARWRARSIDLPDYYLVLDPDEMSAPARQWWFGVLAAASPIRVVASRPATSVVNHLPDLRPGPWWPSLDSVLADLDTPVVSTFTSPAPAPVDEGLLRP